MNPALLRSGLAWIAALLLAVLWYYSQSPWSEFQAIFSERNWSGFREYSETRTPDEIGANFYFGGSFVLLLAAAWLVKIGSVGESTDRLGGVVTLSSAALAIVAIFRFKSYLDSFPGPQLNRYGGSGGHGVTSEFEVCLAATIALIVVGAALLFLGPAPKVESPIGEVGRS